jgi:uncharacterized protein (DUF2249 family)
MPPAAEVFIQATATDPDVQARGVIEDAQRRLLGRLAELAGPEATEERATALAGELSRLLTATDQTLYAAASGAAETRLLVRALRSASDAAARQGAALPGADDRDAAARTLEGALGACFGMERDVLLPALAALPGVDVPDLAADFTTVLAGGVLAEADVVDVREIPHGRRHPRIFTRFGRLAPGESFVLVNNHDPKPLRREFEAAHPGGFSWEYVESGPERWQVRITRTGDGA